VDKITLPNISWGLFQAPYDSTIFFQIYSSIFKAEYLLFISDPCIMSIIVEPTLPYTTAELKLEDPKRWSRLFPLMRPSIKSVQTASGETVVVDTALAKSKDVLIAAVGSVGNFSSKILSESHLAAFTTEPHGKPNISAEEIQTVLKDNGFPIQNGIVVVRSSSTQDLRVSRAIVELSVEGELKLDHILSLLSATNPEIK
jgi:dihydroxyacetone kinase